jgi:4'-phosphopantetheinyl transferase
MPQEEVPIAAPHWPLPPREFSLADDSIHVWCAALDEFTSLLAQLASTLCPAEREQAGRFRFDRHRQWFIVRRGLLRILLGRYLKVEPDQLVFECDARGKPSIREPRSERTLHFNMSDSSGLALYAVTRRAPVGVDVERIKPIRDQDGIAARFFSGREKTTIGALSEPQKSEAFFNCWTRKEAYLKATGEGISESLPRVEVTVMPGEAPRLLGLAGDERAATEWTFYSFEPTSGFVGAVAIKATGLKLSCWRWPES